jgi:hypothetical protein
MIKFTPKFSLLFQKKNLTLLDIPKEILFTVIFSKADIHPALGNGNELYELATLIKRFGHKKHLKPFMRLTPESLLSLIHCSQTNKCFYNLLGEEIKRRVELSHVSYDNAFSYFATELPVTGFSSFNLVCKDTEKGKLTLSAVLKPSDYGNEKLLIDNNYTYTNLYLLCDKIINSNISLEIGSVCKKLQIECKEKTSISLQNVEELKKLLNNFNQYNYLGELKKCDLVFAKVSFPIAFQFSIATENNILLKYIKICFLENQNLFSIFSNWKTLSNHVSQYLHAHDSFLQTLSSITLDSEDRTHLIFTANCGINYKSIIPINIMCNEQLTIADR